MFECCCWSSLWMMSWLSINMHRYMRLPLNGFINWLQLIIDISTVLKDCCCTVIEIKYRKIYKDQANHSKECRQNANSVEKDPSPIKQGWFTQRTRSATICCLNSYFLIFLFCEWKEIKNNCLGFILLNIFISFILFYQLKRFCLLFWIIPFYC